MKESGIAHHHFATKRFDRGGQKIHSHALAGLLERDFNKNQTTYKELLIVAKRL